MTAVSQLSDQQARAILVAAYRKRGVERPTLAEVQAVQAIARFEGGYGRRWDGAGIEHNNWGAVQCLRKAPCPDGCFQYTDSDHRGVNYQGCFRRYQSPVDGAADLIMELYRRDQVPEALQTGDARAIAHRMKAARYFTAAVEDYARAMEMNAKDIAEAVGEPHLVYRGLRKEAPSVLAQRIAAPAPAPTPAREPTPAAPAGQQPARAETEAPRAGLLLLGLAIGGVLALRMRRMGTVRRT